MICETQPRYISLLLDTNLRSRMPWWFLSMLHGWMPEFARWLQAVEDMGCGNDAWLILAQNAMRTGRLPILDLCLANMAHAKAAAALRASHAGVHGRRDDRVCLGNAAVALGMLPEAEAHFRAAGRPELVCKMFQVGSCCHSLRSVPVRNCNASSPRTARACSSLALHM